MDSLLTVGKKQVKERVKNGAYHLVNRASNRKLYSEVWKKWLQVYDGDTALPYTYCKDCSAVCVYTFRRGTASMLRHQCRPRTFVDESIQIESEETMDGDQQGGGVEAFIVTEDGVQRPVSVRVLNEVADQNVEVEFPEVEEDCSVALTREEMVQASDDDVPSEVIPKDGQDQATRRSQRISGRRSFFPAVSPVPPSTTTTRTTAFRNVSTKNCSRPSSTVAVKSGTTTCCAFCNIDFKNAALAMMHQSAHGANGSFQCGRCESVLANVYDFWAHIYNKSC